MEPGDTVRELGRRASRGLASTGDERLEARSCIETSDGPLEVIARSRGERWWVSAVCRGRTASGVGAQLGTALIAALELVGVDAVEPER